MAKWETQDWDDLVFKPVKFPLEHRVFDEQKCRICGCTWNHGCSNGCWWVEEDLCSNCVEEESDKSV